MTIFEYPKDLEKIKKFIEHSNIVFTNGCFDVLHAGHMKVLDESVRISDSFYGMVVVGVDSDESVKKLKGNDRPIFDEYYRSYLISRLRGICCVIIFDTGNLLSLVEIISPKVIVKGSEYKEKDFESSYGNRKVTFVEMFNDLHTTKIIEFLK